MEVTSKDFMLRGGDTAFANRQKLLFDQLSIAEKQHCRNLTGTDTGRQPSTNNIRSEESRKFVVPPRPGLKRRIETRQFRGKESIFKRPEAPAPRKSSNPIPDYHRNPHKWIKYSLEDVDTSESSNRQAAFAFLRELKDRKAKQEQNSIEGVEGMEVDEEREPKIVFKSKRRDSSLQIEFQKPEEKVEQKGAVVVQIEEKPVYKNGKVVMPEYVVGQKQKKQRDKKKVVEKVDKTKQMKLDHLEEFQDE